MEVAYLIESLPCTGPAGSKRVKVKASTYSSSGTPYCRPSDTAMAKLFKSERSAAPSLCMSIKISPSRPSSYAPVGHALALAHHHNALDNFLDDPFRQCRGARRHRLVDERLDNVVVLVLVA